ncbi:MAG: penicillin-binding protein activator [Thiothrix sp.]|nr:penicillin-binding protein activator [Thiothrix sp.]HPE59123.1 penicillin-binding protein activator [Thiolinea sp.]
MMGIRINTSPFFVLWGLLGLLQLQGCSLNPDTDPATTDPAAVSTLPSLSDGTTNQTRNRQGGDKPAATIEQGNALLQQGKKQAAATAYYEAAFSYPSPERERIILQAAEITASLGNQRLTNSYLDRLSGRHVQGETRTRFLYVKALLALQDKNPDLALRLTPENSTGLSRGLGDKIRLVRQRAREMGGKTSGTGNARTTPDNNPRIPHYDLNPQEHDQQPADTQTQPAPVLPLAVNRLAVLLPQDGSLGAVGREIYQGIEAARDSYGQAMRTKLYPVNTTNALQQYRQAITDGADMILGPLDKESLAVLLSRPAELDKPILSLNYLENEGNTPGTVYQFGLSPEDEARQIARFAIQRGQHSAIVLTPDSSWGSRLAGAFEQAYTGLGGQLAYRGRYANNNPSTYLRQVQEALRDGRGAGMVFLAAAPTQARLLRPLLQDQAGLLPVYATSHIFSGKPEPGKDADLDGIIYTEIPMVLDRIKGDGGSLDNLKYPRLYAMGMDAVAIARNLSGLASQSPENLVGKTGHINLNSHRAIERRLEFATFINGMPSRLGN